MSANQFTQEQVFSGLRIIWREVLDYETPLDLDMRFMDEFLNGGMLEEIDFGDVIYRLQRHFGFTCARKEWKDFLNLPAQDFEEWKRDIAPRLTFRALVNFISERLKPISFEPITLLGKPCLAAGVFRGVEQLVHQIRPKAQRFGPSTPIHERLSRWQRHALWDRLRWITEERIPKPPTVAIPNHHIGRGLWLKLVFGILIAVWQNGLKGVVIGLAVGVWSSYILCIILGVILGVINYRINPIPDPIETFGDLARYLALVTVDQQPQGA
jgi:hypothetical protein